MAAGSNPIGIAPKDPNAILDYTINWSRWLNGDVISSILWTLPAGITDVGHTNSGSDMTIWLSGGTAGVNYDIVGEIVTVGGRTDDRTLRIAVAER